VLLCQVTWRRPEDRLLLSRACCYTSGALAVREERLVAEQLGRAWHGEEARDVLDVLTAVCVSLTSELRTRACKHRLFIVLYVFRYAAATGREAG
jgi:hypothetical protein